MHAVLPRRNETEKCRPIWTAHILAIKKMEGPAHAWISAGVLELRLAAITSSLLEKALLLYAPSRFDVGPRTPRHKDCDIAIQHPMLVQGPRLR